MLRWRLAPAALEEVRGADVAGTGVRDVPGRQLRLSKLLQSLVGGRAIMEVTMEDLE